MVGNPTPAGLTFVSNSGDCTTPFPCSLGTLTTGQTRTITATFAVDADVGPGTVVNTATVSSPTMDPAPASNTAAFTTEITGSTSGVADLILTKTASHDIVAPGGAITYSVVATNEGPDSAGNVDDHGRHSRRSHVRLRIAQPRRSMLVDEILVWWVGEVRLARPHRGARPASRSRSSSTSPPPPSPARELRTPPT